MKVKLGILMGYTIVSVNSLDLKAQNQLLITDLKTKKESVVKPGWLSYIKCYYQQNENKRYFFSGYVQAVTDSSIFLQYSRRGNVPISTIHYIDKVTYSQAILPSLLAAVVGFGVARVVNPTYDPTIEAAIHIPCIALATGYVLNFNRKRLKRNKVGDRINIQVVSERR